MVMGSIRAGFHASPRRSGHHVGGTISPLAAFDACHSCVARRHALPSCSLRSARTSREQEGIGSGSGSVAQRCGLAADCPVACCRGGMRSSAAHGNERASSLQTSPFHAPDLVASCISSLLPSVSRPGAISRRCDAHAYPSPVSRRLSSCFQLLYRACPG